MKKSQNDSKNSCSESSQASTTLAIKSKEEQEKLDKEAERQSKAIVKKQEKLVPQIPTATLMREYLADVRFNPREHGPLKEMSDQTNQDYLLIRAKEAISQANIVRATGSPMAAQMFQDQLILASRLLTLARIRG